MNEEVYPLDCPFTFTVLTCEEIAEQHQDCSDPDCMVCGVHEALVCND